MAFTQQNPELWWSPAQLMNFLPGMGISGQAGPGILANLTPTPVPSGDTLGGAADLKFHVTVAPAGGAGTYTFNHGLQWTPTVVIVEVQGADGVTPTVFASWCPPDTNSTVVAVNVSGNCTLHVMFG